MLAVLPPVLSLLTPARASGYWIHLLPFLAVAAGLVHLRAEGYRWQMLPAYVLVVFLLGCEVTRWMHFARAGFSLGLVALVLWLGAVVLSVALPVFEFPKPTGPFQVGTEVRHLADPNRRETLSNDASDPPN